MIKFRCPKCNQNISVKDETAGRKARCRGCGAVLRIPDARPPEKDDGEQGVDSLLSVNYEKDTPPLDSSMTDMIEEPGPPETTSFQTEPNGKKKSLPTGMLIGAGAAVLVLILGIMMLTGGGDDDPDEQRTKKKTATADRGKPVTDNKALLEKKAEEFDQYPAKIRKAKENDDIVELLALNAARRKFVAGVPEGIPRIDEWKHDYEIMEKAGEHTNKTEYSTAIELLQKRWDVRKSAPILNGDLGLLLAKVSLAQQIIEDTWGLSLAQLQALLKDILKGDPTQIEAEIMLAWSQKPDPHEELLRLELRPMMNSTRNQPLLRIRTQLGSSRAKNTLSRRTLDKLMAAIAFSLGQSRRIVQSEYGLWRRGLSVPYLTLYDAGGNPYYLWKGLILRNTIGGWEILILDESGEWTARKVRLVLYRGRKKRSLSGDMRSIGKRLFAATPVTTSGKQRGCSIAIYNSSPITLEEILTLPLYTMSSELTLKAWNRVAEMGDARNLDVGAQLGFTPEENKNIASIKGKTHQELDAEDPPIVLYDLDREKLFAVLEPAETAELKLKEDSYFQVDWKQTRGEEASWPDRLELLFEQHRFALATHGGGKIFFPLVDDKLQATSTSPKAAVGRTIIQVLATSDRGKDMLSDFGTLLKKYARNTEDDDVTILADAVAENRSIEEVLDFEKRAGSRLRQSITELRNDIENLEKQLEDAVGIQKDRFEKRLDSKKEDLQQKQSQLDNLATRENTEAEVEYDKILQYFTSFLAYCRYGVNARENLVLYHTAGRRREPQLSFYQKNGTPIKQIGYTDEEIEKLAEDRMEDFIEPSWKLVPNFSVPELASTRGGKRALESFLEFAMEKAKKYADDDKYHLAATIYREAPMRPLPEIEFDVNKPVGKDDVEDLQKEFLPVLTSGINKLKARREYAAVLEQCNRHDLASKLLETGISEWRIIALAFFKKLEKFSLAYGYTLPDCAEKVRQIEKLLKVLEQTGKRLQGPAKNDPHVTEKKVNMSNALLARMTDVWKPLVVDDGGVRTMTPDEIAEKPAWKRANNERPASNTAVYTLRRELLQLAGELRVSSAKKGAAKLPSVVDSYNAIGTLCLAAMTDEFIPGAARFEPEMLRFLEREIKGFLQPQMISLGVPQQKVMAFCENMGWILSQAMSIPDNREYRNSRYYWSEYSKIAEGFRRR